MLTAIYLSAVVLLVTAFCTTRKRLHLFELLAAFLVAASYDSLSYSYFLNNLKWITVPENTALAIVRAVNTELLVPLLVVWGLDWTLAQSGLFKKLAGYAGVYATILGVIWLIHKSGVYNLHQPLWLAIVLERWVLIFGAVGAVHGIRYLMRKDGIPRGSAP